MSFFSEEQNAELRELFFESAQELLQALNEEGLELEKRPTDAEVARRIRRTVHTLKGDSAAAGFMELSTLAHALEDALDAETSAGKAHELAELVLRAADSFASMLALYRQSQTPDPQQELLARIRGFMRKPGPEQAVSVIEPAAPIAWTEYEQLLIDNALQSHAKVFRLTIVVDHACPAAVAMQMVRNVLDQAGSLLAIRPEEVEEPLDSVTAVVSTARDQKWLHSRCLVPGVTTAVHIEPIVGSEIPSEERPAPAALVKTPVEPPTPAPAKVKPENEPAEAAPLASTSESTLRVDSARIDAALNLLGELIIGKSMLTQNVNEFNKRYSKDPLRAAFDDSLGFLGRTLSDLQKSIMKIRMVPVEQLFRRFPRIVRDLSRACGKEAHLQITGATTDLDKSILDLLAEPLSHIVRNSLDHGLETPEDRVAAGKPRAGTVALNAYHQGNHIMIECSDDGRGIDRERLVQKAIASGITSADEVARMTESEVLALIFHPGLSTAAQVTAISGRGVGMDVVKTVLGRLKGTVDVESAPGKGTTIRLKVPLTVAIIKALMFRVGERLYAIPLTSVVEITRARQTDIHQVEHHEVLQLRGEVLTLVRVEKLNRRRGPQNGKFFVVVVSHGDRKCGLIVDSLVGEEELVIKALDDHLVATEFVSGGSILGDGSVVLILNLQAVVSKLGRRIDARALEVTA